MIRHVTVDITSQRMRETQQAIVEQRTYVASLRDPALKAVAVRTLATLEDLLLIMQRTHGILVATATDPDHGAPGSAALPSREGADAV